MLNGHANKVPNEKPIPLYNYTFGFKPRDRIKQIPPNYFCLINYTTQYERITVRDSNSDIKTFVHSIFEDINKFMSPAPKHGVSTDKYSEIDSKGLITHSDNTN